MKKPLLFLLMIVILALPVIAAPPFVQTGANVGEIQITVPKNEYFPLGSDSAIYFHVFNSTGALLDNTTTDCYIHIYNLTGAHIVEQELIFDSNLIDYVIPLNSSITTSMGLIPYIVWCNNTLEGGFISSTFEVNTQTQVNGSPNITGLAIVLLALLFFFLALTVVIKGDEWFHKSMRLFLVLLSVWLLVITANLGVSYVVAAGFAPTIITTMTVAYNVVMYFAFLFSFLLVLYYLYEVFMSFQFQKEKDQDEMMGR